MRAFSIATTSALALFSLPVLSAQTPPPSPTAAFTKNLSAVFSDPSLYPKSPAESRWLDGGDRYTVLEASVANPKARDIVAYDTASGQRTVLVTAAQLTPASATAPLDIEDYAWSADKQRLLLFTNTQRVWRLNTRGDYWVLDLATGKLTQLGGSAPASTLMFAKFSPDSHSVAYVRDNNIYVESLGAAGDSATHAIRQLTTDGSADIINGTSDWVNEEELDIRDAFRWSPDSQAIAYWQFDQSGVGTYTLLNDTATLYPKTFQYKYPLVGTTNSSVRAGVVPAAGGPTVWFKLPGDPRNHYIVRLDWAGNSTEVAVEYLNRAQNDDLIYLADAHSGSLRLLFEDKDAAFLDVGMDTAIFRWLPSADKAAPDLLWLSERDGWRHAYRIDRASGAPTLLTAFPADVIQLASVDGAHGLLYFTASPTDPIRTYLYRSRLDGTGAPERVTSPDATGTNRYNVAPDGKWAIHTFTNATTPARYELVALPSHHPIRDLEINAGLPAKLKPFLASPEEFTETPIGGGLRLSTFVIKPPGFDPTKKYPVLVYIYGEPADATVADTWLNGGVFLQLIAREGYIVLSFDNQGTPEPRGRAWRKAGYGAIGVLSSQQQSEALHAFAAAHPWVDTTRTAIWGWSGGGTNTLNMMFRYPGLFTTGIAVAPVPDQTRYDTIYQERYMGLPAENAKGYHDGSAINFASGLAGNLLLIHGSGDDNVHFQGSELLVNRLIELGKPFDFMDYPNRTHGIYEGPGTSLHVYSLIARYLEQHVPAGPR